MQLLDVRVVAKLLKMSGRQVYKLARSGRFVKPVKLAGSTRWRADDIALFIGAGCDMAKFEKARRGFVEVSA
jgi:predicted DNA-binding transcriptional regulator AlpA